ncbi:hypothetical protein GCM10009863_48120 [Streptomyces axinellae]|uniref:Uncharacterized protein n=1 Tax=Streptomyces axinellae TaxID=552788 RepID=A0ABP6CWH4_9ACTN
MRISDTVGRMEPPFVDPDSDALACGICPAKRFPRSGFVVYDRPTREAPFNPADGFRYDTEGTPVCVHPHKVGLAPDRIAPPPESVEPEVRQPRRRKWPPFFRAR